MNFTDFEVFGLMKEQKNLNILRIKKKKTKKTIHHFKKATATSIGKFIHIKEITSIYTLKCHFQITKIFKFPAPFHNLLDPRVSLKYIKDIYIY